MATRRPLSVALVHHPVLDTKGEPSTSTLTTMDVHDLSRSARTYGCESLYIVHPIPAQRELAHRIVDHWTHGSSAKRIPDRKDALAIVRVVPSIEDAVLAMKKDHPGSEVESWVTAARVVGKTSTSWSDARALARQERQEGQEGPERPILLLFGTSWGLAPSVIDGAHLVLDPIHGAGDWNHLSVRAACAIALDRLLG